MLLCKDGANAAILEEVLEALQKSNRREAISVALQFAGKVFTSPEDLRCLERKHEMLKDILHDSWTYQKVRGEGRVEGERRSIETATQARFPELVAYVKERIASLTNEAQLQEVLNTVIIAQTALEVKQTLATLAPHHSSK